MPPRAGRSSRLIGAPSLHTYSGMLTTSFTVGNMIKTIDKATLADTGRFLRYDGVTEPW
jgi:hypothetical protein